MGDRTGRTVHSVRTDVAETRLTELTRAVLAALDTRPLGGGRAPNVASPPPLRELHRRVVTADLPSGCRGRRAAQLVIVPHGPLAQVPLAALEDPQGIPLVARHTLSIAPSVSVFRYSAAKRRTPAPAAASMVFASPDAPGDAGLRRCRAAFDEGRRVASRLARFRADVAPGHGPRRSTPRRRRLGTPPSSTSPRTGWCRRFGRPTRRSSSRRATAKTGICAPPRSMASSSRPISSS